MSVMLSHKLRFSDVAFAIDTTPKALRNWLQRGQVDLISPEPEGSAWREFLLADVAILSLVRRIVDFGIQVTVASALALKVIEMQGATWFEIAATPEGFSMFWTNRHVALIPDTSDEGEGGWRLEVRDDWSLSFEKGNLHPASAYIAISPEQIFNRAFRRALTGNEPE